MKAQTDATIKSERITVLASSELKDFLVKEAQEEGISVSELIRRRCVKQPMEDEQLLLVLCEELRSSNKAANKALDTALAAVDDAAKTIKRLRADRDGAGGGLRLIGSNNSVKIQSVNLHWLSKAL